MEKAVFSNSLILNSWLFQSHAAERSQCIDKKLCLFTISNCQHRVNVIKLYFFINSQNRLEWFSMVSLSFLSSLMFDSNSRSGKSERFFLSFFLWADLWDTAIQGQPLLELVQALGESESKQEITAEFSALSLSVFIVSTISCHRQAQPHLELKTRPKFCTVSLSLSMSEVYPRVEHLTHSCRLQLYSQILD